MKKITLLVSERERERFISELRKAGVVHIKHVKPPEAHDITFIEDKISNIDRMVSILSPYIVKGKERTKVCNAASILEDADRIEEIYKEKMELSSLVGDLKGKLEWFDAWGHFDPGDLEAFKERGLSIKLFRLKKDEFARVRKQLKYQVIKKEKGYVFVAVFLGEGEEELPFREVFPPQKNSDAIKKEIDKAKEKIARIISFLQEEAGGVESLKECKEGLKRELRFLNVKFGMQEEGQFAYLQGFCPVSETDRITSISGQFKAGYLIEEPDKPEETPTLITNPKWIRIINPIFKFMNTLPGYNEFDISFVFLVFFSLFFAMLIGDAGYGILFLLVTFLARRKFRHLPPEPFFLLYLLSTGTVVWGAITGTWFGAERIAQLPFFKSLIIGKISSFAGDNQNFLIYMCFLIGVTQLTIARLLRGFRRINSVLALAELGWISILWGMFFAAGKFVIGRAFPPFAGWLLISGMGLVLFFSNPQKGILKGALITLADLPLSVIGSFSDIVSYLRLFAVGYATVVVADSFNTMALANGIHNVIGALGAAIILFLGHMLNIILGFMAVIVHGIRLNMLEFSGQLGMQWSGRKYEPFAE